MTEQNSIWFHKVKDMGGYSTVQIEVVWLIFEMEEWKIKEKIPTRNMKKTIHPKGKAQAKILIIIQDLSRI